MTTLLEKIRELQGITSLSKHEQIVNGVIEAINMGIVSIDDQLPSINKMVDEIGYARKTFVRAYTELKERGLIASKKKKGYYIISQETYITLKVALVLPTFQPSQELIYNTFRETLGKRYHIDVFFHHHNLTLFTTTIDSISKKYGMYVIAPIPQDEISIILQNIPPNKLLIINQFISMPKEYSYITQRFDDIIFQKLVELTPRILKYKKIILVCSNNTNLSIETQKAFTKYLKEYDIRGSIKNNYKPNTLQKNTAYFFISDIPLWKLLKDLKKTDYRIGSDIGILTYNDSIAKEIIFDGITTIAIDYETMAKKAAYFVKEKRITKERIPLRIKQRNSL